MSRWSRTFFSAVFAVLAPLTASVVLAQPPTESPAELAPAAMQRDAQHLYARLQAAHYDLFARRSKAEYDARFQTLLLSLKQPQSRQAFERALSRFVAFGNVAHARIDAVMPAFRAHRLAGGTALPLQIHLRKGEAYVIGNYSGVAALQAGSRLLAIDGQPITHWLTRMSEYVAADTPYLREAQMEGIFPALLWTVQGSVPGWSLSVQLPSGELADLKIPARTRPELLAAIEAQPAGLNLDEQARSVRQVDADLAYLRPGPFYNPSGDATQLWNVSEFSAFLDQAFAQIQPTRALLIDLRDNPGGDHSFSDLLLKRFAQRPFAFASSFSVRLSPESTAANAARLTTDASGTAQKLAELYTKNAGKTFAQWPIPQVQPDSERAWRKPVFILINRRSYSNAALVAAQAQDYGFAEILGEETADLATTYGAMESFSLPESGIEVGYPKALIVRPSGAQNAGGVVPDFLIETPLLESAEDPVLQAAWARVRAMLEASPRRKE